MDNVEKGRSYILITDVYYFEPLKKGDIVTVDSVGKEPCYKEKIVKFSFGKKGHGQTTLEGFKYWFNNPTCFYCCYCNKEHYISDFWCRIKHHVVYSDTRACEKFQKRRMKKVSRAQMRGKSLDPDCKKAHRNTNTWGKCDKRVLCFGLTDPVNDEPFEKCLGCRAFIETDLDNLLLTISISAPREELSDKEIEAEEAYKKLHEVRKNVK